jgi:hypothetical protein
MKSILTLLAVLLLAPLQAADVPRVVAPTAGSVTYASHPHFRWQREVDVKIDEVHRIQIARDDKFTDLACDDQVEVVSRFVPVKPLVPGKYWWRIRRQREIDGLSRSQTRFVDAHLRRPVVLGVAVAPATALSQRLFLANQSQSNF